MFFTSKFNTSENCRLHSSPVILPVATPPVPIQSPSGPGGPPPPPVAVSLYISQWAHCHFQSLE